MPKIPTFQSQRRITAEASGLQTGIQISPTATPAAALADVARVAEEYYIKQRDNNEKLEAKKKFYEMKSESDKIIESQKNNSDEFQSVNIYNQQFGEYRKQQLSQIKNKRVKQRLETLLDIDQAENVYNIKKNSFIAMEKLSNELYNQEQNSLGIKYTLENNPKKKNEILNQQINSAAEYENIHGMGEAWLKKETKKIIANGELFNVEKAIANNQFDLALNILKQSKSIDVNQVQTQALKIENEYKKVLAKNNIDNIILNDVGVLAVGGQLQNIDGSEIKKTDLEDGMNRMASATNSLGQNIYTPDKVIEKSIKNNTTVPFYKNVIVAGSANISDTGDQTLTKKGLELYKYFKTQNGLPTLRTTYNLDKETLETYARLDFATNVLKETFDSAFKRELQIKNKPETFRLRSVSDKKIDSEFNNIDMEGLFLGDIQNVQTTKYLLSSIANMYYKAGGTEEDALAGARKYIEDNYRQDMFNQVVPRNNFNLNDEEHDVAIKLYIKKIYDEGLINKEKHKLDDIYPAYFSYGNFNSQQGFVLTNKKTNEPLTIDASLPSGDFDDRVYNSSRLTQKDVINKVYPLYKNKKFDNYSVKFELLKQKNIRIQNLKQPILKSGFGDPIE